MSKAEIKEQEIINYISKHSKEFGYPPTIREICKAVGLKSTSSVHLYLSRLAEKGLISKGDLKTRALKVVNNQDEITADEMFEKLRVQENRYSISYRLCQRNSKGQRELHYILQKA